MANQIYEVQPTRDDENLLPEELDGQKRNAPRDIVLKKGQLARFRRASDRLHANDGGYNAASYARFLFRLLCVVLAIFMLRAFIAEPTYVDGQSMTPTLKNNERVLVEKVSLWFSEPKRGDIVIVHYPNRSERFVKRVIAVGGETISIENGYVCIDGKRIDESAYAGDWYGSIERLITCKGSFDGRYTVPNGYLFVMGDNRNDSHDSRAYDVGPIALDQVVGHACFVIWPLSGIRSLD